MHRAVFSAICAMVVGLVCGIILKVLGINPIKSERVVSNAKRDGTIAEAVLVRSWYCPGDGGDRDPEKRMPYWLVTYNYTVGQKTYHYRRKSLEAPPEKLTLYYDKRRPKHAYAAGEHVPGGAFYGIYLLMAVTFLICYWIVFSALPELGT